MTYELRKKYNQELLNHSFLDSPWIAGQKDLSVYDSINPKELPSSGDNFPNFSRWYRYTAFGNDCQMAYFFEKAKSFRN